VKKWIVVTMAATGWLGHAAATYAQNAGAQPPAAADNQPHRISDQELELLRKDLRSQKKQMIAQNLKLSDADATKFWPIYDRYVAELTKINDKKYSALQRYVDDFGTLTDDQALALIRQFQEVDIAAAQLRARYTPIVAQAIGGRKAATFAQIDRRLQMMVDLQLGSRLPLVQAQGQ
jgi:hypothetical protein